MSASVYVQSSSVGRPGYGLGSGGKGVYGLSGGSFSFFMFGASGMVLSGRDSEASLPWSS